MQGVDLELFRDIPGYKAILKAVLKSQIQVLVEQLARQTGEESVLLTACIEEGTLSQLGSDMGKGFIDGHDDIKSQFLGFCIKRHHLKQHTRQPTAGLTRKRGPNTVRRQRSNANSRSTDSKFPLPSQHASNKLKLPIEYPGIQSFNKTSTPKQHKRNPAKRARTVQVNRTPVRAKENVPEVVVKKEPVTPVEPDVMNAEMENQSKVLETGNQSTGLVGGNQTAELDLGNQSSAQVPVSVENGSFTVVTEDGDSVFAGILTSAGNQTWNGSEPIQDHQLKMEQSASEEGGSFLQETTSVHSDNKTKNTKPDFLKIAQRSSKRKVTPSAKKKLKEELLDLSDYMDADDRPYPCTTCPKRFKERHHLTYHLRTHSGQRPYVCEICNKAFTQTSSLNTHRKIHMNEINCGMCDRTFKRATDFSNHVCYVTEQLEQQGGLREEYSADNGPTIEQSPVYSDEDLILSQ